MAHKYPIDPQLAEQVHRLTQQPEWQDLLKILKLKEEAQLSRLKVAVLDDSAGLLCAETKGVLNTIDLVRNLEESMSRILKMRARMEPPE